MTAATATLPKHERASLGQIHPIANRRYATKVEMEADTTPIHPDDTSMICEVGTSSDGIELFAITRIESGIPTRWTEITNKDTTNRVVSITSSATPEINVDNCEFFEITALAVDITSMTSGLTGTPYNRKILTICITGTAARTITWGPKFAATTIPLPDTTVGTAELKCTFLFSEARDIYELTGVC